jgi:hypothetical protein
LGLNFFSIITRTLIALFCFVAYYWSENPDPVYTDIGNIRIGSYPAKEIPNSGDIFFLLGMSILLFTFVLIFVVHIKLTIIENYIVIERLWSKSIIKIDLQTIKFMRKTEVKYIYLQRAIFNLSRKSVIKFYTSGEEAIELVDKNNTRYIIGTQKAAEMIMIVEKILKEQ